MHINACGTLKRENAYICDLVARFSRCERKPTPNVKVDTICAKCILCKQLGRQILTLNLKKLYYM